MLRKSFCLHQHRSGIMRLFVNFVKHFVLTFFTSLRCRIVSFVSSTEAELCGVSRFSSSTALTFFRFPLCCRIVLSVNRRARDYETLSAFRQLLVPRFLATFVLACRAKTQHSRRISKGLIAFLKTVLRREANYIKGRGSLASVSQ